MTPDDIIDKLFSAKGVTKERIRKAQGLAIRAKIDWQIVLMAMTTAQQQEVEKASA